MIEQVTDRTGKRVKIRSLRQGCKSLATVTNTKKGYIKCHKRYQFLASRHFDPSLLKNLAVA